MRQFLGLSAIPTEGEVRSNNHGYLEQLRDGYLGPGGIWVEYFSPLQTSEHFSDFI